MRRWIYLAACALPLTGCTPNDPTLGASLRYNYAQQVIDPDPHHAGLAMEGGDGAVAAGAQNRYRTDKIKKPHSIRTTNGISGGGGGGGSGMGAN